MNKQTSFFFINNNNILIIKLQKYLIGINKDRAKKYFVHL